jgi:DNA-directed RNA polymerase specialized sigma24 family protein
LIFILKTWRILWKVFSAILFWVIVLVTAAVLVGKILDMSIPSLLEEVQYNGRLNQDDYGLAWRYFEGAASPTPNPEEVVLFKECLDNIYLSMTMLPPNDVDVFMMKYFDNCRVSEISAESGWTRSKIYTSLENTRKNIRQDLQSRGQLF